MKSKCILIIGLALVLTSSIYSQEKPVTYMGYVEFGAQKGMTNMPNSVMGFKGAYNSIVKEKYLIGLNFIYAFEENFTKRAEANHLNRYNLAYVNFGVRNKVCKNFYITPSFGIGSANYTLTDYKAEEVAVLNLSTTSLSVETETKYDKVKDKQVAVPINLNLLYTSKYIGVGLNLYLIASKYTEMGAGVSIVFGKVRN